MTEHVREAARAYLARGWQVVPVPRGHKAPRLPGWPALRLTAAELDRCFDGSAGGNIGLLLGRPSGGLVDVDLDSAEAVALARQFLPATAAVFGRAGKPSSHRLYRCEVLPPTTQYRDPDGTMLVELRADGCQTIVPPSQHPSGEPVRWESAAEPARVEGGGLAAAVRRLAAAALLARHWPAPGSRHEAALALAGALVRAGWTAPEAAAFIEAVAHTAGDDEPRDRARAALDTALRHDSGHATTGLRTLARLAGSEAVRRLMQWLGLRESRGPQPGAGDGAQHVTGLWAPRPLLTAGERAMAAGDTFVDRYVAYATRRTDAPVAFHEALALVALSAVIGRRAVLSLSPGHVYPALWVMLVADSTMARKSTSLELMRDLIEAVDPALLSPNDFTPQRFLAILAESEGAPLVFVRDEFSGFYEALNRLDFMAGLKETLCATYDGRSFCREKMRSRSSPRRAGEPRDEDEWRYNCPEPFLSIAAGTTLERLLDVARPGDVHAGFLPRFALIEPPPGPRPVRPVTEIDPQTAGARRQLIAELKRIAEAPVHLTLAPEALDRLNRLIQELTAEAEGAPDRSLAAIVGERHVWMAVRAAMLLAAGTPGQRVTLPLLLRGMALAEGWRQTSLRVLGMLAPSRFERRAARLIELVRQHPQGIRRRDVMRSLRLSKREIDELEETLIERGELRLNRGPEYGGARHYLPPPPSLAAPPVDSVAPVTGGLSTRPSNGEIPHTPPHRPVPAGGVHGADSHNSPGPQKGSGDRCDSADRAWQPEQR